MNRLVYSGAVLMAGLLAQRLCGEQSCESLTTLKLPLATIDSAMLIPEGPFKPSTPSVNNSPPPVAPARCVVKGTARPTSDSAIKFEVWLPASGWNGKFRQAGNGGWAGAVPTQSLIDPVQRGYAAAGSDDGHEGGGSAAWAVG